MASSIEEARSDKALFATPCEQDSGRQKEENKVLNFFRDKFFLKLKMS